MFPARDGQLFQQREEFLKKELKAHAPSTPYPRPRPVPYVIGPMTHACLASKSSPNSAPSFHPHCPSQPLLSPPFFCLRHFIDFLPPCSPHRKMRQIFLKHKLQVLPPTCHMNKGEPFPSLDLSFPMKGRGWAPAVVLNPVQTHQTPIPIFLATPHGWWDLSSPTRD